MANTFQLGNNIQAELKGHILTLTIDTEVRGKESASGKSIQVASTGGNQIVPGTDGVIVGLNVYVKK